MTIAARLEKNRNWIGAILIVASWVALYAPDPLQIAILVPSAGILLVGVGRTLSNYKWGLTEPRLLFADKLLVGVAFLTLLALGWYRYVYDRGADTGAALFPLLAALNLPRPRGGDSNVEIP